MASASTIGDKLMIPESTPQRGRDSIITLDSDRSGLPDIHGGSQSGNYGRDLISSRASSIRSSNYGDGFGPSLNAALSHHFHYETATPFNNSRQGSRKKKGRFLNANTIALPSMFNNKRASNIIDFGPNGGTLNTSQSAASINDEQIQRNIQLSELAHK